MKETDLMDQLKVTYKSGQTYPKKFCLGFFDFLNIACAHLFIVYIKYMEKRFPHSQRVKLLKVFKHEVAVNLIGKFFSRKPTNFMLSINETAFHLLKFAPSFLSFIL